jgi:hypothetical protein
LYRNKSQTELAKEFQLSRSAIQNQFKRLGIKARTNAESQSVANAKRFIDFSYEQKQLAYGSLLGDACLCRQYLPSNKTGVYRENYRINNEKNSHFNALNIYNSSSSCHFLSRSTTDNIRCHWISGCYGSGADRRRQVIPLTERTLCELCQNSKITMMA